MSKSKTMLREYETELANTYKDSSAWVGPGVYQIPINTNKEGTLIKYGYELIKHTSVYFGPKGTLQQTTNGMNCTNCHLEAGTKPWGLNFGSVYSTYPKFRARSGSIETIYKRVNDCFERSLNGKALDTNSKEMKAIYAYIKWLGNKVPKGVKVNGSGIEAIPFMQTAADVTKGEMVYTKHCSSCHGTDGAGKTQANGDYFLYPPLWGKQSYNDGAGMNQITKLAGFVKNNMPNNSNYHQPVLTNEDAWNVAAFINSHNRPYKDKTKDWPDLATKPIDYPIGPYVDGFSEKQHQIGPFKPIQEFYIKQTNKK